jgi:hypothetical protein
MSMKTSFPDRTFQLWEYQVSHGTLLIRSPKAPGLPKNIDLVCIAVEYLAVPRHIKGLDLQKATTKEIEYLSQVLASEVQSSKVQVIVSQGQRFPIVALQFSITENDGDIFESPFFHPRIWQNNATMQSFSKDRELYDYLQFWCWEFQRSKDAELRDALKFAVRGVSLLNMEFLSETRIALRRVLERENGFLTGQERENMINMLKQIDDGFEKRSVN